MLEYTRCQEWLSSMLFNKNTYEQNIINIWTYIMNKTKCKLYTLLRGYTLNYLFKIFKCYAKGKAKFDAEIVFFFLNIIILRKIIKFSNWERF